MEQYSTKQEEQLLHRALHFQKCRLHIKTQQHAVVDRGHAIRRSETDGDTIC